MAKTKTCSIAPRHKWTFVENVKCGTVTSTYARFSTKGLYRCECGAKKYGEYQREVKS